VQPAPAAASVAPGLAKALEGLPVTLKEVPGGVMLSLSEDRQFPRGASLPGSQTRALLQKIAIALDKQPGAIVVIGHADATPAGPRYASNAALSAARARAAARFMAPKLADPKRLSAEGRGNAEPLAPNDSEAGRAKNRRVAILAKTAP
jgi:type VI secretion system protein ImpK